MGEPWTQEGRVPRVGSSARGKDGRAVADLSLPIKGSLHRPSLPLPSCPPQAIFPLVSCLSSPSLLSPAPLVQLVIHSQESSPVTFTFFLSPPVPKAKGKCVQRPGVLGCGVRRQRNTTMTWRPRGAWWTTTFLSVFLPLCSYICVTVYWVIMLLFLPLEAHALLSSER